MMGGTRSVQSDFGNNFEFGPHQVLDAAQDSSAEKTSEHSCHVEEGQRPDQQVECHDLLTAVHSHKLVVAAEVATTVEKQPQKQQVSG